MKHIDVEKLVTPKQLNDLYSQSTKIPIDSSYLQTAQVIAEQGKKDFLKEITTSTQELREAANDEIYSQAPTQLEEERNKRNHITIVPTSEISFSFKSQKDENTPKTQQSNISYLPQNIVQPRQDMFELGFTQKNGLENILHLDNYRPLRQTQERYFYQITPFGTNNTIENKFNDTYHYNIRNYQKYGS